jgi:hypothetical protein
LNLWLICQPLRLSNLINGCTIRLYRLLVFLLIITVVSALLTYIYTYTQTKATNSKFSIDSHVCGKFSAIIMSPSVSPLLAISYFLRSIPHRLPHRFSQLNILSKTSFCRERNIQHVHELLDWVRGVVRLTLLRGHAKTRLKRARCMTSSSSIICRRFLSLKAQRRLHKYIKPLVLQSLSLEFTTGYKFRMRTSPKNF